jgi:hypothetical protein
MLIVQHADRALNQRLGSIEPVDRDVAENSHVLEREFRNPGFDRSGAWKQARTIESRITIFQQNRDPSSMWTHGSVRQWRIR